MVNEQHINPMAMPFKPPTQPFGAATSIRENASSGSSTAAFASEPDKATTATTMMATAKNLPSLPILSAFLLSHFQQLSPLAAASEVGWLYHSPLPPRPHWKTQLQPPLPAHSRVQKLVLSVTPTEGVYTALGADPLPQPINKPSSTVNADLASVELNAPLRPPRTRYKAEYTTAAFLHRPWMLTRARLPRGTTVWASHKAFDESLTVGCNIPLLARLGVNVQEAKLLVGYKGDEGRRIGAVGGFERKTAGKVDEVRRKILSEFRHMEGWFGFGDEDRGAEVSEGAEREKACELTAIACMNAFHPAEVDRVAVAAVEAGFATSPEDCSGILYLTGAVREEGLQAALQKGMKVACVGHQACEVWGIAYLAERVRDTWPDLQVEVVDEEEVKHMPQVKAKKEVKSLSKQKGGMRDGKERTKGVNKTADEEREVDSVKAGRLLV
jgi:putative NIF3 family GTP cyclohydrolase 1 type 2